jgi:putative GTP pyrophosphokinase
VGARVVCWFVDDCYGFLDFIRASNHFRVANERAHPMKDFIKQPQQSGYRAIHVFTEVQYDSVQREKGIAIVKPASILCEIQVRTKLQDAWGDITHEFYYKARTHGVEDNNLENFLSDVSDRLQQEDKTLMKFRDTYQRLSDAKTQEGTREGFKSE